MQLKSHKSGVSIVLESDTVRDALRIMADENIGSVVALKQGKIAGILTERDVLKNWERIADASVLDAPVSTLMSTQVLTIQPPEIKDAAELMLSRRIRHLPVVDANDDLIGILSIRDILNSVMRLLRAVPKTPIAAPAAVRTAHFITPQPGLLETCKALLPPSTVIRIHQAPADLAALESVLKAATDKKPLYLIDMDELYKIDWRHVLKDFIAGLTRVNQPDVFLFWSASILAPKDIEALSKIAHTAHWSIFQRPIAIGLLEDLLKGVS